MQYCICIAYGASDMDPIICPIFYFLKKQTCTCIEAARTSCIIEAKPITKKNQYQVEKH